MDSAENTGSNAADSRGPASASSGGGLNFQIDSDWKAQARAEKERLSQKASPTASSSDTSTKAAAASAAAPAATSSERSTRSRHELPAASFETLLSSFVTQALYAMGMIPDPQTGQPALHLDLARHQIDLLAVLEAKTKNNLTEDEAGLLAGTLYELRNRYVQVANAARGG